MTGTFDARIDELARKVGSGKIVAKVEVDQVYAKYQHEGLDLKHPGGGKAMYLRDPLQQSHDGILRQVGNEILEFGPRAAMLEGAEKISQGVYEQAPLEFGDLKASPHPTVTDDGSVVYDRPPMVHRLSKDELRIKSHLRNIGLGNR